VREVTGSQVRSTLMDGRGESDDLLGLVFRVLGDRHGAGTGGDDCSGNDGEARDFHGSDVSAILIVFKWGQVPSGLSLKDYIRASFTAVLHVI
jgi:hypothetical protein